MAWFQTTHNGTAIDVVNKIIAFLTADSNMVANNDAWVVLGNLPDNTPCQFQSNHFLRNGKYLRGPGNGTTFVYMLIAEAYSTDITHSTNSVYIHASYGFDNEILATPWAQPGADSDYNIIAVPLTSGPLELMGNSRRWYGYIGDNLLATAGFYFGWLIPYVTAQVEQYPQPLCMLGTDRYVRSWWSESNGNYNTHLTLNGDSQNSSVATGDRSNKGHYLAVPGGTKLMVQAGTRNDPGKCYDTVCAFFGGHTGRSSSSPIFAGPATQLGRTPLFSIPIGAGSTTEDGQSRTVYGELDGILKPCNLGLVNGAIINSDGHEYVVVSNRNTPSNGADFYALRRA